MLQHQAQREHKLGANSPFLQAGRSSLMEFCSWQRGRQPDPLIFPALNEFEICVIEKGKEKKNENQTLESKRRGLHSHPDSENCLRTHFTPKLAFPLLLCFRGIQALIQGEKILCRSGVLLEIKPYQTTSYKTLLQVALSRKVPLPLQLMLKWLLFLTNPRISSSLWS